MKKARIAIATIVMFIVAIVVAITVAIHDNNKGSKSYDLKKPLFKEYDENKNFGPNGPEASSFDQLNPTFDEEVGEELYYLGKGAYYDRENERMIIATSYHGSTNTKRELEACEGFITAIDPKSAAYDPECLSVIYSNYANANAQTILMDVYSDEAYAEECFATIIEHCNSFKVETLTK